MRTTHYYVDQHKVDEGTNLYRVMRNTQEWGSDMFPRDVEREPIHIGLNHEYARLLANMYNANHVKWASKAVEIYVDDMTVRDAPFAEALPIEMGNNGPLAIY